MPFTPFSAKNSKVRINGTVLVAKRWSVTPKNDPADVTNFEGAGYGDYIGTIIDGDVEITDCDIDGTANPWDAPLSLRPGTKLTNVRLYLNASAAAVGGPCWIFPSLLVTETPNTAEVRGVQKMSLKGKGCGTFTFPTGNAV